MSRHEELIGWLTKAAMFGDCAVLGVVSVIVTSRFVSLYFAESSALKRIKLAPEVRVSDLKTLISSKGEMDIDGTFVVVEGVVDARSNLGAGMKISTPDVLVSQQTGDVGVVLERTQLCKYNVAKGYSRWAWSLRYIFSTSLSEPEITTQRKVPFALVDNDSWPQSKSPFVLVNLDGSNQQLPVDTIFQQIHVLRPTPFAFIRAIFGHEYPIAVIEEEKMLLIGKEVYAAGICSSKDGVFEIRSSKDFSYFLSDMNKSQMVADLTWKNRKLFWGIAFLGSITVGILGYSAYRNWNKWKQWRLLRTPPINNTIDGDAYAENREEWRRRRMQQPHNTSDDDGYEESSEASTQAYDDAEEVDEEDDEEDNHDIPIGESCVICLVRSRGFAFVPCGHQVCCHRCANNVLNEASSQCPVCRQDTIAILRIYQS